MVKGLFCPKARLRHELRYSKRLCFTCIVHHDCKVQDCPGQQPMQSYWDEQNSWAAGMQGCGCGGLNRNAVKEEKSGRRKYDAS